LRLGDAESESSTMSEIFEKFSCNRVGRDFVAGDVHGCFDQLDAALELAGFDPERDRCFCVGDLVDRGPSSAAVLDWLAEPWLHSCRGNHEEMALTAPQSVRGLVWWLYGNGGDWWLEQDAAARQRFTQAFRSLPLAMEVDTVHGRVGIVHADVPDGQSWPELIADLEAGDVHTRHVALWGRDRAEGRVTSPVEGIDRVVCGHTISPNGLPQVVGNVWLIDTGAFLQMAGFGLTLMPLERLFFSGEKRPLRSARR